MGIELRGNYRSEETDVETTERVSKTLRRHIERQLRGIGTIEYVDYECPYVFNHDFGDHTFNYGLKRGNSSSHLGHIKNEIDNFITKSYEYYVKIHNETPTNSYLNDYIHVHLGNGSLKSVYGDKAENILQRMACWRYLCHNNIVKFGLKKKEIDEETANQAFKQNEEEFNERYFNPTDHVEKDGSPGEEYYLHIGFEFGLE